MTPGWQVFPKVTIVKGSVGVQLEGKLFREVDHLGQRQHEVPLGVVSFQLQSDPPGRGELAFSHFLCPPGPHLEDHVAHVRPVFQEKNICDDRSKPRPPVAGSPPDTSRRHCMACDWEQI